MSKGKKIGGIILIILGTIGLVLGLIIGGLFGAVSGSMDDAVAEVERQIEDARATGVSTFGEIIDIDSDDMATVEFYCEETGYWYETYIMVMSDTYHVGSIVEVCYDPYRIDDSDYTPVVPELMLEGMDIMLSNVSVGGIVVGVVIGVIGLILLIIGIVMLVSNKKDKKWVDEINARNAAMGIGGMPQGGQPMNGFPQGQQSGYPQVQPGQPNGYPQVQPGQPMNSYGQPPQDAYGQQGGYGQPNGQGQPPQGGYGQ